MLPPRIFLTSSCFHLNTGAGRSELWVCEKQPSTASWEHLSFINYLSSLSKIHAYFLRNFHRVIWSDSLLQCTCMGIRPHNYYFIGQRHADKFYVCCLSEVHFCLASPGPQGVCCELYRNAEWLLSTPPRGCSAKNYFKMEFSSGVHWKILCLVLGLGMTGAFFFLC